MKFIVEYKLFEGREEDKYDDYMYSKNGVYLFQFISYYIFETFVYNHKDIFDKEKCKWSINPLINSRNSEEHYNRYMIFFPIFCIIIDTIDDTLIGLSMTKDCTQKICVNGSGHSIDDKLQSYLDRLGITAEELID